MDLVLSELMSALMRDNSISVEDRKYVLKRLAAEGITFLTVELPKLSKAVIVGLETGFLDRATLTSFRFRHATIRFLGTLINRVFNEKDGSLLLPSESLGAAVGTIRQICDYAYKLALPYSEIKEKEAKENFISNEKELKSMGCKPETLEFANELRKDFENHWSALCTPEIHEILKEFRPRSTNGTFVGSDDLYYVDRVSNYRQSQFPFDAEAHKGFFKPYPGFKAKGSFKRIAEPGYSELLLVPKDSRGPRTICRETLKRVETQMAYFDFMAAKLPEVTSGAIDFTDQTVNRGIAEESSVTKMYATLDLKDASDRVSQRVVSVIFRNSPGLRYFFTGSRRATHVNIDGELMTLHKVAGMGSGLTFPTMSILISLAICNGVKKHFRHLQYGDIRKDVFVYGDDICVPTKWARIAIIYLTKIGLKVNELKSFSAGHFRESCGADYYYGVNVTPCRLKLTNSKVEFCPNGRITMANNAMAFKQLYEHSKELWKHGFKNACLVVMGTLRKFYFATFGIEMAAGKFDEQCDLPVDYTKGTRHLLASDNSIIYAIQPVRTGGSDITKVISRKGRVHELSPYFYLAKTLSTCTRDTAVSVNGKLFSTSADSSRHACALNLQRTMPQDSPCFGEITHPRQLTFVKKFVLNDFLIESIAKTRDDYLDDLARNRFWSDMAALIVLLRDGAYL